MQFKFKEKSSLDGGGQEPPKTPPKRRGERPERPSTVFIVGFTIDDFLGRSLTLEEELDFDDDSCPEEFIFKKQNLENFLRSIKIRIEGEGVYNGCKIRGSFETLPAKYVEVDSRDLTDDAKIKIMQEGYLIREVEELSWGFSRNDRRGKSIIKGVDPKP